VLEAHLADYTVSKGTGVRPTAFSKTCDALGLTDRTDPITALVAEKIVELAQRGLRNPTAIHMLAMRELKSDPNTRVN